MSPVTVRSFPSGDTAFADEVALLVGSQVAGATWEPGALQVQIRRNHPNATITSRDDFARRGDETGPLWYAFRDGSMAAQASAPRRVLVLDDDEDFAEMLAAMLLEAGYDVRRAHDGLEGLDVATEFAPNLILLDLGMPRATGEQFAERYRLVPEARAQIVVVSGLKDAATRARATGARAVITKPFEMDAFLRVVHQLA
jgi:CheY-like chemotaxis protein